MPSTAPHTNWSGTVTYGFDRVDRPATLDETRELVQSASRLRVVGTGHTFNKIADGERAVSLDRMSDVTVEGGVVRVAGAATFTDVALALRPHDLALANLASLPHISVAGAVATATHGSGLLAPNLSSLVRRVEAVTAAGDLVSWARGDDEFDGAVVSLGALGVVTALELDTVPALPWRQVVLTGLPERELSLRLDQAMRLGESVSVMTRWDGGPARVWVKHLGDPLRAPWPAATEAQHPIAGIDPQHATEQHDEPGWWADRLPHFRMGFSPSAGDEVQSEYHVDRRHSAAAVEALRAIGPQLADTLLVCEVRTVARDAQWLSPQHDRDTCSLHFTWVGDQQRALAATRVVEQALDGLDPRPHWGKVFALDPRSSYPRLDDFLALRARLDPDRVLVNPWLEQVLLGG